MDADAHASIGVRKVLVLITSQTLLNVDAPARVSTFNSIETLMSAETVAALPRQALGLAFGSLFLIIYYRLG